MQVTETLKDGLKRGYDITVTAAEMEAKVTAKLIAAQPEVEIKGFRKGKVPLAMLKKQFGQRLMGEAMQEAIDTAMNDHFAASGDRPALQPQITMKDGETWKDGDDVVIQVSYEALPDIPDVDVSGVVLERMVVKADAAAIDEALAALAETAQNFADKPEGAAAETGDQVVFDFLGRVDGEAFDGGAAEDYPLVLGSGSFIPGFEDQLIGSKAGEEKQVAVKFPETYGAANLAGKDATFDCKIKAVKAPEAAAIDDEMAKRFGADSLDALKGQIAERLEAEYKSAARAVLKRALLDRLDAMVAFDLPSSLVDAEAGQIAHQLWHEEHPEVHDHHHGSVEPTDEHKALAMRRVRLGLLLAEIGRKAEVQVTDAEFTQVVLNQARQYPGQERQFFEFVQQNQQMQQQLRAPIFEDKVVDHILSQAQVSDRDATKDDLQKAVEALDQE